MIQDIPTYELLKFPPTFWALCYLHTYYYSTTLLHNLEKSQIFIYINGAYSYFVSQCCIYWQLSETRSGNDGGVLVSSLHILMFCKPIPVKTYEQNISFCKYQYIQI